MTPTPTEQVRSPRPLRRLLAMAFGLALVGGLATACSSEDNTSDANPTRTEDSNFPVTVDSTFGKITIEKKPERVVVAYPSIAEDVRALGVEPIIVGESADANGKKTTSAPWETKEFKKDSNIFKSGGGSSFNLEAVSNYNPDLIIGNSFSFSDTPWENSQKIAPSFGGVREGLVPFEESLDALSLLLTGSKDKSNEVKDNLKRSFSDNSNIFSDRNIHTYNFGTFYPDRFGFGNGSILEYYGLSAASSQDNVKQSKIPMENISDLDGDIIISASMTDEAVSEAKDALEKSPSFKELKSYKEENVIFLSYSDEEQQNIVSAINGTSAASAEWLSSALPRFLDGL